MRNFIIIFCLLFVFLGPASSQDQPDLVLLKGHTGQSEAIAVSALSDPSLVATAGTDGMVKVWNLDKLEVVRNIYDKNAFPNPNDIGPLSTACFSPDRSWVVTRGPKGEFRRFSLPDGKLLDGFSDPNGAGVVLATDGKSLFYFHRDKLLRTDLGGSVQASLALKRYPEDKAKFALSPDFTKLAFPAEGGIAVYDASNLQELVFREIASRPLGFRFSNDSARLALSTSTVLAVFDSATLNVLNLLEKQKFQVDDKEMFPIWDGENILLVGKNSGRAPIVADLTAGTLSKGQGELIALSEDRLADGRLLLGGFGGSSWLYDFVTQSKTELAGDIGGFPAFAIDPVEGDLVTGSRSGEVVRWDAETGRDELRYEGLDGWVATVDVSPDRSKVLGAGFSVGDIICWDAKTGKQLSKVSLGTGRFGEGARFARFVDSDRYILSSITKGPKMRLIQASTGKELNSWSMGRSPLSMALNPSRTRVVVGFAGGLMEADLLNKRDVLSISRRGRFRAVCYDSDGKTVLAANRRGFVYEWDTTVPGKPTKELTHLREQSIVSLDVKGNMLEVMTTQGGVVTLNRNGSSVGSLQLAESWVNKPTRFGSQILALDDSQSILFFDAKTGEKQGHLAGVRDNKGWVAMDRTGQFDGNGTGMETISFELDGRLFGVDQFMNEYFRPGVLARLLPKKGQAPSGNTRTGPVLTASNVKKPPKVDILSPASGTVIDTDTVEVRVKVASQGGGVADVALFHNGHKLPERQKKNLDESTVLFTLKPVKGKNEFRATAFDSTRSVEARQDRVRVVAPNVKARPPRLHLLSVGVDEYTSGLSLKFAENDATSVSKLFSSALYAHGERKLLSNEQATLSGIKAALESIAAVAEPQDAFVFYLAGHGTVIGEDYYFLPHDVKIDTDQSVAQTALSSDDLGKALQSVPATKQLLVLDSCRSGAAAGVVGRYFASRAGLEEIRSQQLLARASGTFLIAATKGEEYAYEIPDLGHGVLTYALLDSLGVKGSSARQGVTANDLLRAVSTKVPQLSEQYHGVRQQVIQYSSGQDFPLIK